MVGVAVALAVAPLVLACGNDGRELREPSPDQTTTSTVASTVTDADAADASGAEPGSASGDASSSAPQPLALASSAFADGSAIPRRNTCRGADLSPPLRWGDAPAGTVELAVAVQDLDAEGFIHWVIAGLAPDLRGLAEDRVPDGAVEAVNDFGRPGYGGPCPPSGTHRYEFRVIALDQPSGVEAEQPGGEALAAIEALPALGSAVLEGTATAD